MDTNMTEADNQALGFWDRVKSYFLEHAATFGREEEAAEMQLPPDRKRDPSSLARFVDRVSEPTEKDPTLGIYAASIGILHLDEVKSRVGDRWPRLSGRIDTLVSQILNRRLGEGDAFFQRNDTTYLVAFADRDTNAVELKTAMIEEEIHAALFGTSDAFRGARVEARVGRLHAGTLIGAKSADADQGDIVGCAIRQLQPVPEVHGPGPDEGCSSLQKCLRRIGQQLGELQRSPGRPAAAGSPDLGEIRRLLENVLRVVTTITPPDSGHDDSAGEDGTPHNGLADILGSLIAMAGGSDAAASTEQDASPIRMSFEPVFYVPRKTIGLYRCQASLQLPTEQLSYRAILDNVDDPEFIGTLDRLILEHAIRTLYGVLGGSKRSAVLIPVSYRTLNWPKGQREYLNACKQLSPTCRSLVIWEIHDVPIDSWSVRLAPLVNVIKPYGRQVFMLIPVEKYVGLTQHRQLFRRLASVQANGVRCVVADLSRVSASEERKIEFLDAWAESAEKSTLHTSIQGVDSLSLAMAAVGAGIDYISGPAVADSISELRGVNSKEIIHLYVRRFSDLLGIER